jgi:hypothetical protein
MMSNPYIQISIVTAIDTTAWDFGRHVLTEVCKTDPKLVPQYADNVDPIKRAFADIADCEQIWAPEVVIDGPLGRVRTPWTFRWKRIKSIRCRGDMYHTIRDTRERLQPGWLRLCADMDKRIDWLDLFKRLCVIATPTFATLHLFTAPELVVGAFGTGEMEELGQDDFVTGPPAASLEKRGIPNLAWATFFGQEYVKEIDARLLLSKHFDLERMKDGYLLVLTDNISDVDERFDEFCELRKLAKSCFRDKLFLLSKEPFRGVEG